MARAAAHSSDGSQIDVLARFPEQTDRSFVYVDYVEVAPSNLKTLMVALGEKPLYSPIGSRAGAGDKTHDASAQRFSHSVNTNQDARNGFYGMDDGWIALN